MADPTPATSADIAAQTRILHNDGYAYSRDVIAAIRSLPDYTALLTRVAVAVEKLGAGAGSVAAAPPAAPAGTVDYFPAHPGEAPFPSPENSRSVRVGDEIQGAPYLVDRNGTIYRLLTPPPAGSSGVSIGNRAWQGDASVPYQQLILRAGGVWMQAFTGQWQYFSTDSGSTYNGSLPDAVTAPAGANPPATSAVIAPVPPAAIQPGTSGRVLTVGTDFPTFVAALAAAKDGDTIACGARTIAEDIPVISKAVMITGGTFDFTGRVLAQGKGGIVPTTDIVLDGVTILSAGAAETEAGGTAGVRPAAACRITVRRSVIRGCQNGIAGGGVGPWTLTVEDSTLDGNGLGDGYTHDIYVSGGAASVELNRVTCTGPRGGHAVKSRASTFSATGGRWTASEATVLDLPNGTATRATLTGVALVKSAGDANHGVISYGVEGGTNGLAGLVMSGGTIEAYCDMPFVQAPAGATLTFAGVKFLGGQVNTQGGGTAVGLSP